VDISGIGSKPGMGRDTKMFYLMLYKSEIMNEYMINLGTKLGFQLYRVKWTVVTPP